MKAIPRLFIGCVLFFLAISSNLLAVSWWATGVFQDYGRNIEVSRAEPETKSDEDSPAKKEATSGIEDGLEDREVSDADNAAESQKAAQVDLHTTYKENIERFYELVSSPTRPEPAYLLFYAVLGSFLFLLIGGASRGCDIEGFIQSKWITRCVFPIQAVIIIGLLCLVIGNYYQQNVAEVLAGRISDSTLLEAAISEYERDLVAIVILTVFYLVVLDIISFIMAVFIDSVFFDFLSRTRQSVERSIAARVYPEEYSSEEKHIRFHNDMVEVFKKKPQVRWFPVLTVSIQKEVLAEISLDQFFNLLLGDSKNIAFTEIRKALLAEHEDRITPVVKELGKGISKEAWSVITSEIKMYLEKFRAQEVSDSKYSIASLLQSVVDANMSTLRQNIAADIEEMASNAVEEFQNAAISEIEKRDSNGLLDPEQLDVLPHGTRYILKHGKASIVVVEEPPQVRTLHFTGYFLREDTHRLKRHKVSSLRYGSMRLALPYTVFMFMFSENSLHSMMLFYRNEPIRSLEDEMYLSNLPNTWCDGFVCHGFRGCLKGSISEKVETVLSHFWQSVFNTDLMQQNYKPMTKRDKRFRDIWRWEKASAENPLFVLNVDWIPADLSLNSAIRKLKYSDPYMFERQSVAQAVKDIIWNKGNVFAQEVSHYCESVQTERIYPNIVDKQLNNKIDVWINAFCDQLLKCTAQAVENKPDLTTEFVEKTECVLDEILEKEFAEITGKIPIRRKGTIEDVLQSAQ